ncbi:MAG: oxygen-independent coproporphyrinogen III oxidase, partial [Gammaproteobacteria bacterium]|nr:oxygen-independent coproporphyrinogen III oxidase [Gammaproteobacteria bacterium]
KRAIEFDTDRISVFNYAHLPEIFKPQRRINIEELPSATVKLDILKNTIDQLTDAGYVYIGMDHFAKPDDELAVAQREGSLYRNFQGYSTHSECDLIGMGVSSIGMVGDSYSQNVKTLDEYYARIDEGRFPVLRGLILNADDKLRREVITQLICHFALDKQTIEQRYQIVFDDYFKSELAQLKPMQDDGLLIIGTNNIEVQPVGHLLIRNICMVFDKYLHDKKEQRFSKVI